MTKKSFKKADPNYQKELAKYGNPIPSRDYILQIIRENNAPMSREEILTALSIKSDEQQEAMRRRLRAMENDGQLVFTKRKRYALPEKLDLFKGMVIGHREGYGFLQVEGKKEDLFIPNHQMQRVMHGDFVLAQPAGLDRRGRREVRIVRVLESRKKQIVGRFFLENGFSYVVPDDSRIGRDILVPNEHRNGARMGQVVVVELQERSASFTQPVGIITEILTIWQKEWKWRSLFVIMTFLTNSQVRSKNTLKNSRKKCLKKPKKAVWIYAICLWLPLMAKMHAILTMPYIAKKAVKVGNFGWRLPMSAIMCVYVLH